MRFIREFFNPRLRCERVGHEYKKEPAKIRRKTNSFAAVCEDFTCTIATCKQCSNKLAPEDEKYDTYWSSVTMPDDMWDDINQNGFVIVS